MSEQGSPSESKRAVRLAIAFFISVFLLGCVALPIAQFIPAISHIKLWNTFAISDILYGAVMTLVFISIQARVGPIYVRAWKAGQWNWWKTAIILGGLLLVTGFVGSGIAVTQHPDGPIVYIYAMTLLFALLLGMITLLVGYSFMLQAGLALNRQQQQNTTKDEKAII